MSNKTKAACYLIRCLTNTHVGSGDDNYGTVDKLVQRDPITGFPEAHSSGIKGALREFFEEAIGGTWAAGTRDNIAVFGSEKDGDDQRSGSFRFMEAKLLALPKWSNKVPYFSVTTKQIADDFELMRERLSCDAALAFPLFSNTLHATGDAASVYIDEEAVGQTGLDAGAFAALLGQENIATAPIATFKNFSKNLPVIARNKLDNGISGNLWYEEVLPRETRLYWFVVYPEKEEHGLYSKFHDALDDQVVQLGANASIGYGQCHFKRISLHPKQTQEA